MFDDLLEQAVSCFAKAGAGQELKKLTITVGGMRFRLHFADAFAFDTIIPPLLPFATESEEFDEEIFIWDSDRCSLRGQLLTDDELARMGENAFVVHQGPPFAQFSKGNGSLFVWNEENNQSYFCLPCLANQENSERAAPLRTLLHHLFKKRGLFMFHAAAIGTEDGCALLVGKGGSGKSTTAVNAMLEGMFFYGDDYVLLDNGGRVHAVYATAKLNGDSASKIPGIAADRWFVTNDERKKNVYLLEEGRITKEPAKITGILYPQITGEKYTVIEKSPSIKVFAEILLSTMSQACDNDSAISAFLSKVFNSVPIFSIKLGSNLPEIEAAIRKHLAAGK